MGPVRTDKLVAAVHPEDQGWLSGLLWLTKTEYLQPSWSLPVTETNIRAGNINNFNV